MADSNTHEKPIIRLPKDWDEMYVQNTMPWDLATPTPEFIRLEKEGFFKKKQKILIPGAGRGFDAIMLAQAGHTVSTIEFSATANKQLLEMASEAKTNIQVFERDFFNFCDGSQKEFYDIILEYTFFCAIDPLRRKDYVLQVSQLLKKNGRIIGLFFPMDGRAGGPPYAIEKNEVESLFKNQFLIEWQKPQLSVKPREGKELLGIFNKI